MVTGTGLDVVSIQRIREFRERWGERGLQRLFTPAELTYCLSLADPDSSLAARFAAKEAFFKAVRTGWGAGGDWREVETTRGPRGAPELILRGRAAEAARQAGAACAHLSLSHGAGVAAAVVILET
jgi:holo-[acyl-carrier protein] synthase